MPTPRHPAHMAMMRSRKQGAKRYSFADFVQKPIATRRNWVGPSKREQLMKLTFSQPQHYKK